jgi:hypothetical protein
LAASEAEAEAEAEAEVDVDVSVDVEVVVPGSPGGAPHATRAKASAASVVTIARGIPEGTHAPARRSGEAG